jgi:hypothetical protein
MRKNISIKQNADLFEIWAKCIKQGAIPGGTVSGRIMQYVERDMKAFAPKLRKAGEKVKGAAK